MLVGIDRQVGKKIEYNRPMKTKPLYTSWKTKQYDSWKL